MLITNRKLVKLVKPIKIIVNKCTTAEWWKDRHTIIRLNMKTEDQTVYNIIKIRYILCLYPGSLDAESSQAIVSLTHSLSPLYRIWLVVRISCIPQVLNLVLIFFLSRVWLTVCLSSHHHVRARPLMLFYTV